VKDGVERVGNAWLGLAPQFLYVMYSSCIVDRVAAGHIDDADYPFSLYEVQKMESFRWYLYALCLLGKEVLAHGGTKLRWALLVANPPGSQGVFRGVLEAGPFLYYCELPAYQRAAPALRSDFCTACQVVCQGIIPARSSWDGANPLAVPAKPLWFCEGIPRSRSLSSREGSRWRFTRRVWG